jgi:hypothetical protein
LPPLIGALLKSEQDHFLVERMASHVRRGR